MASNEEKYRKALEEIAKWVATDDSGGWEDVYTRLESVGSICDAAGIPVPHAEM